MNKDDLITIVKHGGLDDATTRVVVSEIERGDLSQSSLMIVESIVRKGHFTSPQDIRERADKLRGSALEKGRFGSRSEAGRYAANMRWQRAGVTGEITSPEGALKSLLASGYTIETVKGTDPAVGRLRKDASVAFQASIEASPKKDQVRRRTSWNLVKAALLTGGEDDRHIVLRDPQGRMAGMATVVYGSEQVGTKVNPRVAYLEALGTTGLVRGAGSALLGQVVSEAKSRGLSSVQLVSYDNAIPFYEKLGFKQFRLDNLGYRTNDMELSI